MACYYWDDIIELHVVETIENACTVFRENDPSIRGLKLSPPEAIVLEDASAEELADAIRTNETIIEFHMEQLQVNHVKNLMLIGKAIQQHSSLQRFRSADCRLTDAGAGVITRLATNLRGLWLETDGIGGYGDFLGHIRLAKYEHLEVLSLCDNLVDDAGCRQIMRGLADNSTLVELNLSCNYISGVGASYISDWMVNQKSIKFMHLSWNCIGDDGAASLAESLKVNKTLDVLGLRGNSIGDEGVVALAEVIQYHPCLEILMLEDNKIQEAGSVAIANAYQFNNCITTMELTSNVIGDAGIRAISEGMINTWYLYLSDCNLGDVGAAVLAAGLRKNRSIIEVSIENNHIGYDGARAISQALEENSTLEMLNLNGNLITNNGADALRTVVEEHNMTLRRLELDDAYKSQQASINVFMAMNAAGREMLLKSSDLVWEHALAKLSNDLDLTFLFLKEKPEPFQQRW